MSCKTKIYQFVIFFFFSLAMIAGCKDTLEEETEKTQTAPAYDGEDGEYWHTRLRSSDQELALIRNYGLGFSIPAHSQNIDAVRCQVLNIDQSNDLISKNSTYSIDRKNMTFHTVSERYQFINVSTSSELGFIIYNGLNSKNSLFSDKTNDTCHTVVSTISCIKLRRFIRDENLEDIRESPEEFESYLTPSFKYGLDRIKKSNESPAVIDSFIDIFGEFVITDASIGGKLNFELTNSKSLITSLTSEKNIEKNSLNLYFKEKTSQMSEEELRACQEFRRNSEVRIDALGGDLSCLNNVITNPNEYNGTGKELNEWQASITLDDDPMKSNCELIDFETTPIWEFIPDKRLAEIVKSRITSDVKRMRELYGNRNYTNIKLDLSNAPIQTKIGGVTLKENDPYIVDVIASHKHVATICKEWVPEIDRNNPVRVTYPIYNNKLQNDLGICIHNGVAYKVRWAYNMYCVDTLKTNVSDNTVYLNFGTFSLDSIPIKYVPATKVIGYEWPGSIKKDGTLGDTKNIKTVCRFAGKFYLCDDTNEYNNLPNWKYTNTYEPCIYDQEVQKMMESNVDVYKMCGVKINGKKGTDNLTNRMVRKDNYTYILNAKELGY